MLNTGSGIRKLCTNTGRLVVGHKTLYTEV